VKRIILSQTKKKWNKLRQYQEYGNTAQFMCLRHKKLKLKKYELMNHRQGGSMDMESSQLCALAPKNSFDLEADTD